MILSAARMMRKKNQLLPGQNLRYTGRFFPGFIKEQPYMVFVAAHSVFQYRVNYNGLELVVEKYFTEAVG